jgi:molybdenum cofactor cytidylyltransferase
LGASEERPAPVATTVAAIIAAAGRSRRMGEPKQLLPWGEHTVIAAVATHLLDAGAQPVLCVTGHRHDDIASALTATAVQMIYNAAYATTDMLCSYQTGLQALADADAAGAILALGDQPHIPVAVLRQIVAQAQATPAQIVIPSYNLRRGHPFYVPRRFWAEIIALNEDETLRTVVNRHADAIVYVNVNDDAILRDMDTPAAYAALRAREARGASGRES